MLIDVAVFSSQFSQNSYGKFSAKRPTQSVYIHEQYLLGTSATPIRNVQIIWTETWTVTKSNI